MFQRKLNTVSSKARMKFSNKKMEPLGLLGKSLARHPGSVYFNQTELWHWKFTRKVIPGDMNMKIPTELWV